MFCTGTLGAHGPRLRLTNLRPNEIDPLIHKTELGGRIPTHDLPSVDFHVRDTGARKQAQEGRSPKPILFHQRPVGERNRRNHFPPARYNDRLKPRTLPPIWHGPLLDAACAGL